MARGSELWRRLSRSGTIPLADTRPFARAARRTTIVRLVLAAALVGSVVAAFFVAPTGASRTYLPPNSVGVVVLDVSSSVKPGTYHRIEQTLATIAGSATRLGLVVFSDVAYEALPPGTRSIELKPLLRFFAPQTGGDPNAADAEQARSPWDQWFSAGTRISSGLYLAAHMLEKQHVEHGAVILVSDLADDPTDLSRLASAVIYLDQRKIPLEIVGLDPKPVDLDFFRNLLGDDAIFEQASLPTAAQAQGRIGLSGAFSVALLVFAAIVVVLLAVNEWWTEPLRWKEAA
jgi:hypothetical protein